MPAEGEEMQHSPAMAQDDVAQIAAALLDRLRTRSPRVHCITNAVAQNFTANALLAAGCQPSMTLSAEEIAAFVGRSHALLVNLGTFDRDLVALGPKVVRLNHAEFDALTGGEPTRAALVAYARNRKVVVGLSGETDLVTDGARLATIDNGHPLMAKVTAMGCAASALLAACLAVEPDAWRASAAALVMIGVAGELAAATAQGPGSFAVAILDALHNLDGQTIVAQAR